MSRNNGARRVPENATSGGILTFWNKPPTVEEMKGNMRSHWNFSTE
jgi:hypothetical protein